jgi:hypothetical protein
MIDTSLLAFDVLLVLFAPQTINSYVVYLGQVQVTLHGRCIIYS